MFDFNIKGRAKNITKVRCMSKWTYGQFRGCISMQPRHEVSDLCLDGIKCERVCVCVYVLCACLCICVIMCGFWQYVSICQGTLVPADEEIKSESPPAVTSCPPTPGVSHQSVILASGHSNMLSSVFACLLGLW